MCVCVCVYAELNISLSDPDLPHGRLVVQYDGVPGTICADNFDNTDAKIACKSMGFYEGFVSLYSGVSLSVG